MTIENDTSLTGSASQTGTAITMPATGAPQNGSALEKTRRSLIAYIEANAQEHMQDPEAELRKMRAMRGVAVPFEYPEAHEKRGQELFDLIRRYDQAQADGDKRVGPLEVAMKAPRSLTEIREWLSGGEDVHSSMEQLLQKTKLAYGLMKLLEATGEYAVVSPERTREGEPFGGLEEILLYPGRERPWANKRGASQR